MASDFNKPVTTDNYLDLLTTIRDNQRVLAKMFDGETTSNIPTGSIRWSSGNGRLEKYNGSTWEALLPVATTSAHGLMSSTDKTKLDGVANSANNYVHPTSDGNKHVPATSTTNGRKALIAGTTAGAFSWSDAMFGFEAVAISTATTIAATHVGKFLRVTSAVALTVPTPTSLGLRNGESFTVFSGIDGVTIVRSSSTFAGATGNVDLTLSANEYVQLTVISTTTWQVIVLPTVATSAETITGTLSRKYTTPAGVKAAIDSAAYILTKANIEGVLTGTITSHTHSTATASAVGLVELATTAEAAAGTDTSRAVTAAGVDAYLKAKNIVLNSSVTASGVAIDFEGIPAGVKRLAVIFTGVSTNGSSNFLVQIGSGSVATTGYTSGVIQATNTATSTAGFVCTVLTASSTAFSGILNLVNVGANGWVSSANLSDSTIPRMCSSAGSKTLSGPLDIIRITAVNGTDQFDAGTITISWEF